MSKPFQEELELVTRLRGVTGAMLVSTDDGLVVSEALMEGVRGDAVAALAASLASRLQTAVAGAGYQTPSFLHLQASAGALLGVPIGRDLLLVAVADPDVNVGMTRLEMLRVAERVG